MIKLVKIIQELTGEERSRSQFVLGISRDIINAFKNGSTRYTDTFDFSRGDEQADDINIDFKFIKRPKQHHAFSIGASFGPTKKDINIDSLEAKVEYNPKMFPNAMNAFVAEVKEVLEHEFEHIGQQSFEDMYIMSNRYDEPLAYPEESPQAPTHFLYLTSNIEVPAYVKGLIKRAKVDKVSFEQALENYYSDNRDTFDLYNTDWSSVKNTWMSWATANKGKLKKFN